MEIVYFLLIGAAAGWLAGLLMKGRGFGTVGNIVIGVLGGFVGGYVFELLEIGQDGSVVGSLLTALVGAALLLFAVGLIKKA